MSLFSSIGKILRRVAPIASIIPGVGPIARVAGGVLGALGSSGPKFGGTRASAAALPAIPGIAGGLIRSGLPAVTRRLPALVGGSFRRGLPGIALGTAAGLATQFFDGDRPPKRRRMNPCNDKALRRALRRIEQYDKLRKRVDKSLRKACPPKRTPSRVSRKC